MSMDQRFTGQSMIDHGFINHLTIVKYHFKTT